MANYEMMRIVGAAETAAAMRAGAVLAATKITATTRVYGAALLRQVKANASGRPGPRVQTGDYRRSINLRMHGGFSGNAATSRSDVIDAVVGTNSPQGRRLEHGFMNMTDSLGRVFHQPPYPHFGPAFDHIAPLFEAAVKRDVDEVIAAMRGMR